MKKITPIFCNVSLPVSLFINEFTDNQNLSCKILPTRTFLEVSSTFLTDKQKVKKCCEQWYKCTTNSRDVISPKRSLSVVHIYHNRKFGSENLFQHDMSYYIFEKHTNE